MKFIFKFENLFFIHVNNLTFRLVHNFSSAHRMSDFHYKSDELFQGMDEQKNVTKIDLRDSCRVRRHNDF